MTSLTQARNRTSISLLTYYQAFLAIAAIFIFFTRLDIYLEKLGYGIPLYWMLAFLVASVPLFFSLITSFEKLSKPVILWIAGFIGLTFTMVVLQPRLPILQYFEDQYRTIIFLFLMLVIFAYHPLVTRLSKIAILAVTMLNIGMFIYEFLNPAAFYLIQRAPGRSSGFYDDSNTAAIALVLGMILTIDLIKPKFRLFYALVVFVGLAPTFSRGGIAGWVFVIGILLLTKLIPRYQIPFLGVFFLVAVLILSTQLNNLAYLKTADGETLFQEDTLARVEFLIDPFAQKDDSKASRLHHVEDAWKKFIEHPFVGNGLGAGENMATKSLVGKAQRSHNTYLDFMVEFGFLGALIFPALLAACVWKAQGESRKQGIAFVVFMIAQGFFSHTLVNEFCSLIVYAMMANITEQSRSQSIQESIQGDRSTAFLPTTFKP